LRAGPFISNLLSSAQRIDRFVARQEDRRVERAQCAASTNAVPLRTTYFAGVAAMMRRIMPSLLL
jgi:hypothetical protein